MKKQMLIGIVLLLTLSVVVQAQSFTGAYQLTGVKVIYTNVARATDSLEDSIAQYTLDAHWPSVSNSLFSATLKVWAPGDTIVVVETPDFLLTPAGLAAVGIDLNVGLNQEQGQMLIPGVEGTSPTYPTTKTVDCSTFAVIAPSVDNALITYTTNSNSYNQNAGTFTWGFGISESEVFDWFDAPADWENPTASDNWGILTGYFNDAETGFDKIDLTWSATDGQDSDAGIDDLGKLNRHLGVTMAPGDTVTVAYLASIGIPVNVGSRPILGGEGIDLDGDGEPDGVLDTDWGYYFDPKGPDGIPFWEQPGADDSPFQFTGHYMTYNFLSAVGLFEGLFEFHYGAYSDLKAAFIFAADSTLRKFGAPAAFSAAVTTALADSLTTWIGAGVAAYMAEGLSQEEATILATKDALQAGMLKGIGGTELLATPTTDLFFSEYIEGGSYNKALEIYNGTGAAVDLANYLVLGNYNGNPFNDTLRFPVGTMLSNGDVYVIANDKASSEILAVADTIIEDPYASGTSFIASFNGDDVRGLFKIDGSDTTLIDLFGFYDIAQDTSDDPGSGWDVAGVTDA
ncbi:MAG: lamin tail domain-containing protein, partial [Candidatus Marinimicrobia bacterium]|nr:lamin tail domain-containing protein [Candidatus Neomarinimicrobiota bacterium]